MIINLLRFSFKAGVAEADKERALAAITRTARAPSVAFSFVGRDLGDAAAGFTHTYLVGIADLDALDRYMREPAHREGDFVFAPLLQRLARVGASDDADPAIGDKIMALHEAYMTADPEWAALLASIPELHL